MAGFECKSGVSRLWIGVVSWAAPLCHLLHRHGGIEDAVLQQLHGVIRVAHEAHEELNAHALRLVVAARPGRLRDEVRLGAPARGGGALGGRQVDALAAPNVVDARRVAHVAVGVVRRQLQVHARCARRVRREARCQRRRVEAGRERQAPVRKHALQLRIVGGVRQALVRGALRLGERAARRHSHRIRTATIVTIANATRTVWKAHRPRGVAQLGAAGLVDGILRRVVPRQPVRRARARRATRVHSGIVVDVVTVVVVEPGGGWRRLFRGAHQRRIIVLVQICREHVAEIRMSKSHGTSSWSGKRVQRGGAGVVGSNGGQVNPKPVDRSEVGR